MDQTEANLRVVVGALVSVSTFDWLYADLYLRRAEELLSSLYPRSQYTQSTEAAGKLIRITERLRQAAQRADLSLVQKLAEEAMQVRKTRLVDPEVRRMGERVYGLRSVDFEQPARALTGAQSHSLTAGERDRIVADLRILASHDPQMESLYQARRRHFEQLEIAVDEPSSTAVNPSQERDRLFDAIERGDFARVRQLASPAGKLFQSSVASLHASEPNPRVADRLATPFPDPAQRAGETLGLSHVLLDVSPAANHYLRCFRADHALSQAAAHEDPNPTAVTCACGYSGPSVIPTALRQNLDLLMANRFVTSGGTRYLPWFGSEAALIETFSESAEAAPSELSSLLGLSGKRRFSRLQLEDALRRNAPRVCDALGLDPLEFTVACIPFDIYLRLAARYSWGSSEQWTHFDGYQLMRGQRLCALVGGDVRFGGAYDLCSVGRDYDPERLISRFAVLRRERFEARDKPVTAADGR